MKNKTKFCKDCKYCKLAQDFALSDIERLEQASCIHQKSIINKEEYKMFKNRQLVTSQPDLSFVQKISIIYTRCIKQRSMNSLFERFLDYLSINTTYCTKSANWFEPKEVENFNKMINKDFDRSGGIVRRDPY